MMTGVHFEQTGQSDLLAHRFKRKLCFEFGTNGTFPSQANFLTIRPTLAFDPSFCADLFKTRFSKVGSRIS